MVSATLSSVNLSEPDEITSVLTDAGAPEAGGLVVLQTNEHVVGDDASANLDGFLKNIDSHIPDGVRVYVASSAQQVAEGVNTILHCVQAGDNNEELLVRIQGRDNMVPDPEALAAVQGIASQHPNLLSIKDFGVYLQNRFITVVPFLRDARDLENRIESGDLSPRAFAGMIPDIAAGLDAVHEQGLVHRDVKPSNVLITPSGRPVVSDLDLVTRQSDIQFSSAGTGLYMPAEVINPGAFPVRSHRQLNGKTDSFAMGRILQLFVATHSDFVDRAEHNRGDRRFYQTPFQKHCLEFCRSMLAGGADGYPGAPPLRMDMKFLQQKFTTGLRHMKNGDWEREAQNMQIIRALRAIDPVLLGEREEHQQDDELVTSALEASAALRESAIDEENPGLALQDAELQIASYILGEVHNEQLLTEAEASLRGILEREPYTFGARAALQLSRIAELQDNAADAQMWLHVSHEMQPNDETSHASRSLLHDQMRIIGREGFYSMLHQIGQSYLSAFGIGEAEVDMPGRDEIRDTFTALSENDQTRMRAYLHMQIQQAYETMHESPENAQELIALAEVLTQINQAQGDGVHTGLPSLCIAMVHDAWMEIAQQHHEQDDIARYQGLAVSTIFTGLDQYPDDPTLLDTYIAQCTREQRLAPDLIQRIERIPNMQRTPALHLVLHECYTEGNQGIAAHEALVDAEFAAPANQDVCEALALQAIEPFRGERLLEQIHKLLSIDAAEGSLFIHEHARTLLDNPDIRTLDEGEEVVAVFRTLVEYHPTAVNYLLYMDACNALGRFKELAEISPRAADTFPEILAVDSIDQFRVLQESGGSEVPFIDVEGTQGTRVVSRSELPKHAVHSTFTTAHVIRSMVEMRQQENVTFDDACRHCVIDLMGNMVANRTSCCFVPYDQHESEMNLNGIVAMEDSVRAPTKEECLRVKGQRDGTPSPIQAVVTIEEPPQRIMTIAAPVEVNGIFQGVLYVDFPMEDDEDTGEHSALHEAEAATIAATNFLGNFGSELEHQRMQEELQRVVTIREYLAREVNNILKMQQLLMTQTFPNIPGLSFGAGYRPTIKNGIPEISGDGYTVLADGTFALWDVSGHGAKAQMLQQAFVTFLASENQRMNEAIQTLAIEGEIDVGVLAMNTNKRLVAFLEQIRAEEQKQYGTDELSSMFITAIVGKASPGGIVRWVNYGHPRPHLINPIPGAGADVFAATLHTLPKPQAMLLGVAGMPAETVPHTPFERRLRPGQKWAIYTDGLEEAHTVSSGKKGPILGQRGLNRLFLQHAAEDADIFAASMLHATDPSDVLQVPDDRSILVIGGTE